MNNNNEHNKHNNDYKFNIGGICGSHLNIIKDTHFSLSMNSTGVNSHPGSQPQK